MEYGWIIAFSILQLDADNLDALTTAYLRVAVQNKLCLVQYNDCKSVASVHLVYLFWTVYGFQGVNE